MNSITIYLAPKVIDFQRPVNTLFGSLIKLFPANWTGVLDATAYMAIVWIFLYILYRNKIFLKV